MCFDHFLFWTLAVNLPSEFPTLIEQKAWKIKVMVTFVAERQNHLPLYMTSTTSIIWPSSISHFESLNTHSPPHSPPRSPPQRRLQMFDKGCIQTHEIDLSGCTVWTRLNPFGARSESSHRKLARISSWCSVNNSKCKKTNSFRRERLWSPSLSKIATSSSFSRPLKCSICRNCPTEETETHRFSQEKNLQHGKMLSKNKW